MTTYTSSGTIRQAINDMTNVANPPSAKTYGRLENTFGKAFAATQAATHIITGSLKASGKATTDATPSDWQGTITYGGPSAGPNNPVDYAIYEMARGDVHDFFTPLVLFDKEFESAVAQHSLFKKGGKK